MTTEQCPLEIAESYASLQFTDDFLFCKILTENEDITKELLELILGKKIGIVKPENQKSIEITEDGKGIRLDVYAEDDEDQIFDIEMQTTRQRDLPKRSRYYQAMIDLNQINHGAEYRELKKSYIIFICMNDPFPKNGRYLYSFENLCKEEHRLPLGDETYKVFLNSAGKKGDISDGLKDFLHLIRNGYGESELSKKIEQQVEKARKHDEWRQEYMTLYMRDKEKRAEGFEEGLAKGHEEGLEEGRKATIIKALKKNRSVEDIADFMDCSVEEVEAIKAELLTESVK